MNSIMLPFTDRPYRPTIRQLIYEIHVGVSVIAVETVFSCVRVVGWDMGPAHLGLGEIDGPPLPPGKATDRPSDHWLTAHV